MTTLHKRSVSYRRKVDIYMVKKREENEQKKMILKVIPYCQHVI